MFTQIRISGSLLAGAAAAALLASSPASATLIQTQGPFNVAGTASVTAHQTGGPGTTATTAAGATVASKSFSQFNTANGVLTGATVTISGNRSQTIILNASGGRGGARRANGSGTGKNTTLSAPGISQPFANIGIAPIDCKPNGVPFTCPRTAGPTSTATSGSASASNLSGYAGNGNVTVSLLEDVNATVTAQNTPNAGVNAPYNDATLKNTIGWSGTMALQYNYLAHANPSFSAITDQDILNINFGTVLQGSNPAAQTFALTNLFSTLNAADTVGLDLDLISGPSSPFSLTGGTFSNLLAGLTSGLYSVNFNTSNVGNFSDQILLSLSDFDAGVGMNNYNLIVNLNGDVVKPVPEPASLALLGSALLAAGGVSRRKRRKVS